MGTIYKCCKQYSDVNKSLRIVHEADTEAGAIKWLEENGGGVYKNTIHNLQFYVSPNKEKK